MFFFAGGGFTFQDCCHQFCKRLVRQNCLECFFIDHGYYLKEILAPRWIKKKSLINGVVKKSCFSVQQAKKPFFPNNFQYILQFVLSDRQFLIFKAFYVIFDQS